MILGFTGTQIGMTDDQKFIVADIVVESEPLEGHHGMCWGADDDFDDILKYFSILRYGWPGVDGRGLSPKRGKCEPDFVHEPMPYLLRNVEIVKVCNRLIATPKEFLEIRRSGTWATIRRARTQKKELRVVFPDGSVKTEKDEIEVEDYNKQRFRW